MSSSLTLLSSSSSMTPTPTTTSWTLTTPLPTYADWTPPASCLDTTAWNQVTYRDGYDSVWRDDIFAVPTMNMQSVNPSGACIPPGYTTNVPYITDGGCPAGYTSGCSPSSSTWYEGQKANIVTCCPSVNGNWAFTCEPTSSDFSYGCMTYGSSGMVWSGTQIVSTVLPPETTSTTTTVGDSTNNMWAYAVFLIQTSASSTSGSLSAETQSGSGSSSTPAPSQTNDPSSDSGSSNGLSTGAAAGIGVGVGIAVVAILAAAFFIFRKRRSATAGAAAEAGAGAGAGAAPGPGGVTPAGGAAYMQQYHQDPTKMPYYGQPQYQQYQQQYPQQYPQQQQQQQQQPIQPAGPMAVPPGGYYDPKYYSYQPAPTELQNTEYRPSPSEMPS